MTKPSEFELDLDLQLLPAWAREPSTENRYASYQGEEEGGRHRPGFRPRPGDRRGDRPPRRGPERRGAERPGGPPRSRRPEDRRPGRGGFDRRGERPQRREPEIPLPEIDVEFLPDQTGVESLARQIKLTGRAYPLFDIAHLILRKPERYRIEFRVKPGQDGKPAQQLLACSLDDSVWLVESEVAAHVLQRHFDTFYQSERIPGDPPKGTYTFVAQCGMSGVILGPPNYHDYQSKLRKLHADRFPNLPFEVFKARVKIVKDETVVKQWVEDQSWRTEYICLNMPEPLRLTNREAVEQHFRETHLPNLYRPVEIYAVASGPQRPPMASGLAALLRQSVEQQRRFPLKVATALSHQFASQGLHFFKVSKSVTHVCVSRPHYLDLTTTVVSDGVRRIVEFINVHPGCNRRHVLEELAPTPPASEASPTPPAPAEVSPEAAPVPEAAAAAEEAQPTTPPVEAPSVPTEAAAVAATEPTEPTEAPSAPPVPTEPQPTAEQRAVIADLHWLIHQGHVIEFSDGHMETARMPKPRPEPPPRPPKPPRTEPKPTEASSTESTPAASAADAGTPIPEGAPAGETAAESVPATPVPSPSETAPEPNPESVVSAAPESTVVPAPGNPPASPAADEVKPTNTEGATPVPPLGTETDPVPPVNP